MLLLFVDKGFEDCPIGWATVIGIVCGHISVDVKKNRE